MSRAEVLAAVATVAVDAAEAVGKRLLQATEGGTEAAAKQVASGLRAGSKTGETGALNKAVRGSLGLQTKGMEPDEAVVQRQLDAVLDRAKVNEKPLSASSESSRFKAGRPDETGLIESGYIRAMRDIKPEKLRTPEISPESTTRAAVPYWLEKNPDAPTMRISAQAELAAMARMAREDSIASPASVKRIEKGPFSPTAKFEMARERKAVEKLDDGSTLTRYPDAPMHFQFPTKPGAVGTYGNYVDSVKANTDGSFVLGSEEGFNRIGRGNEKTSNTLGLIQPTLVFDSMPRDFRLDHPHLKEAGVGAWFRGDTTWLHGEANTGTGIVRRPIQAEFDPKGYLTTLKFERPITVTHGPFAGLKGDVIGVRPDGHALLVNTQSPIGGFEKFVYKPNTLFIARHTEQTIDGALKEVNSTIKPKAWESK